MLLEFREVTLVPSERYFTALRGANLPLAQGQMALVRLDYGSEQVPLAAAAEGLIAPAAGSVLFEGLDWQHRDPRRQVAARARIGRVFGGWGWVSNLNVLENVVLARRHHSRDPDDAIVAEADALARQFTLAEVPRQRPSLVAPGPLRVAEWVRALLCRPKLLLLERPTIGAPAAAVAALLEAVGKVLAGGGAAVWITTDPIDLPAALSAQTRRYRLHEQRLDLEEAAA